MKQPVWTYQADKFVSEIHVEFPNENHNASSLIIDISRILITVMELCIFEYHPDETCFMRYVYKKIGKLLSPVQY